MTWQAVLSVAQWPALVFIARRPHGVSTIHATDHAARVAQVVSFSVLVVVSLVWSSSYHNAEGPPWHWMVTAVIALAVPAFRIAAGHDSVGDLVSVHWLPSLLLVLSLAAGAAFAGAQLLDVGGSWSQARFLAGPRTSIFLVCINVLSTVTWIASWLTRMYRRNLGD